MHDIMMAHHKFSGVEDNSSLMVSGPCLSGNMSNHYYFESCQKTTMRCLRCFTMRNITGALESDRDGMLIFSCEREVTRGKLEEEMSDHFGFIWEIKMLLSTWKL